MQISWMVTFTMLTVFVTVAMEIITCDMDQIFLENAETFHVIHSYMAVHLISNELHADGKLIKTKKFYIHSIDA